jgi:hypothetical protein
VKICSSVKILLRENIHKIASYTSLKKKEIEGKYRMAEKYSEDYPE